MPSLQNVLGNIPLIGGYEASRQLRDQRAMQDMSQYTALQKLMLEQQGLQQRGDLAREEMKQRGLEREASLAQAKELNAGRLAELQAAREQRMQELQLRLADSANNAAERNRIMLEIAQLRQQQSTMKPPSGYRFTQAGDLEAIPGGPADTKQQGVLNADTAVLGQASSSLDRLQAAAHDLKRHPGLHRITGLVGAFPDVPGSAASDARAKLQNLKAQVGFSVLQDMRNAAANKASGLGQITERELNFLQNALASIETAQSEKQLKEGLDTIIKFVDDSKNRLRQAYNLKHGDKPAASQPQPAQPSGWSIKPLP